MAVASSDSAPQPVPAPINTREKASQPESSAVVGSRSRPGVRFLIHGSRHGRDLEHLSRESIARTELELDGEPGSPSRKPREPHGGLLRRSHPRNGAQRSRSPGVPLPVRSADALDRSCGDRGRSAANRGEPAPPGLPPQHARVLPPRARCDAVVSRPRARPPRRALHRARAKCLRFSRGRPHARVVAIPRADSRIDPGDVGARRGDGPRLDRRVHPDRRGDPRPRSAVAAPPSRRTRGDPRTIGARTPAPRALSALAPRARRA